MSQTNFKRKEDSESYNETNHDKLQTMLLKMLIFLMIKLQFNCIFVQFLPHKSHTARQANFSLFTSICLAWHSLSGLSELFTWAFYVITLHNLYIMYKL